MVKMIAKTRFTYAGMNLRVGDSFLASDKDAKLLRAIKKAELAPVPVPPAIVRAKPVEVVEYAHADSMPTYAPAEAATSLDEQIAAAIAVADAVKAAPAKKRTYTYKRKDMRAETDE
jgi:hypothetical protein